MFVQNIDRMTLRSRHRLSHQQIDRLLGENRSGEYLAEKMQQLDKVRRFVQVVDLLQGSGVVFLCLKGPVLSQQLYGDPAVRFSHDVDLLLLDRADMDRVDRLLISQGYVGVDNSSWPEKRTRQRILMDCVHHLAYVHKEHGFMVEIHWSVYTPFPVRARQFERIVADNSQRIDFAGREVLVFAQELNLLYLVIHGAKHGWQRLKWLVDIKDYPFENVDPGKWTRLVRELKSERIVSQTGFLLCYFFNITQPLLVAGKLPSFLKVYPLRIIDAEIPQVGSVWNSMNDLRYRLMLCKSYGYKLRLLQSMAISPSDMLCIRSSSRIVCMLYRPYSYIKRRIVHA
jgi:hypothetical protein